MLTDLRDSKNQLFSEKCPLIIAFEGIDGSGKTSCLKCVENKLIANGKKVKTFSFPEYDSFFGVEIGELLSDKKMVNALTIDTKSMSLWYALDRWNALKGIDLSIYDYVFFNRYTLSSIVYQSIREKSDPENLCTWIYKLEHEIFLIPRPSLYIIFDIAPELAQNNLGKKGNRIYIGDEKDLYEKEEGYLKQARDLYKDIQIPGSKKSIIAVSENNVLMDIKSVSEHVLEILKSEIS